MLRHMEFPWFSTDWVWEHGQRPSSIATEDFYFYTKARAAGYRLFADTAIQCQHEDRETGTLFGLNHEMRQAGGQPVIAGKQRVADVGSGMNPPVVGEDCTLVRFDMREDVRPDVRCDIRHLPEDEFGLYDVVHARHVLEHFPRSEAPNLIRHWAQLLKVGGQMIVEVPNVDWAFEQIKNHTEYQQYAWEQLYGGQRYDLDFHKNGFTGEKLQSLLATHPCFEDIVVEVISEQDENLRGTAKLARADTPEAVGPMWKQATQVSEDTEPLPRLPLNGETSAAGGEVEFALLPAGGVPKE
jgi:SAM-dependent methyltransferase